MFDLTLSRNLEDVGRVHGHLRVEGFRRLVLFGSSMGGGTALWYAAFHPNDIAATVLIAPAVDMEAELVGRLGPAATRRWERDGHYRFEHELGSHDVGWTLIEDLRTFQLHRLRQLYRTPTLVFQGKHDDSVSWRSVVDFVTSCAYEKIALHLMADGDHRLLGRLDELWRMTADFLAARGLVPHPR